MEYRGWDWAVFITGLLQFGLGWIIIGWAWSIWWGVRMLQDAQQRKMREEGQQTVTIITQSSVDSQQRSNSIQAVTVESQHQSIQGTESQSETGVSGEGVQPVGPLQPVETVEPMEPMEPMGSVEPISSNTQPGDTIESNQNPVTISTEDHPPL